MGKVFNPKLLKSSSFTLKDTLTRSHRNQSLYNRSRRIYIYLLYITSCKGIQENEKNLKIVVKKMYFQPILLFECYCFQPSHTHRDTFKHKQVNHFSSLTKNPLFHHFL